ncbi:MAG: hypothetical protein IPH62_11205 [Ignavibacteriae bacterium]|nr:hypothetical protein [Ignavibacteriota bacterium]
MGNKIGIGIITCNRSHFFKELISSIPEVDKIVVVNDGNPYENNLYPSKITEVIQHKNNKGIAKTKNDALKYLLDHECEHIYLFEDDIAINDSSIIEKYIKASEISGIQHFNYAYHGKWNKTTTGNPNPKKIIRYSDNVNITLHDMLTGALSYFRSTVLKNVGLMDTRYKNVLEHVDHTYRIIKSGFHPPFRWFADIEESFYLLRELDEDLKESINAQNMFSLKIRARIFDTYFKFKNGFKPSDVPIDIESDVEEILREIKNKFSTK